MSSGSYSLVFCTKLSLFTHAKSSVINSRLRTSRRRSSPNRVVRSPPRNALHRSARHLGHAAPLAVRTRAPSDAGAPVSLSYRPHITSFLPHIKSSRAEHSVTVTVRSQGWRAAWNRHGARSVRALQACPSSCSSSSLPPLSSSSSSTLSNSFRFAYTFLLPFGARPLVRPRGNDCIV